MQVEYIYCILEREFINSTENIYKIGKTKQTNVDRFKQYSKGSILIFHMLSTNCSADEYRIIQLFKTKYVQRTEIGSEYFSGNIDNMMRDMFDIVSQTKKKEEKYKCDVCNYTTQHLWVINDHLVSERHLCMVNNNTDFVYCCETCPKKYKSSSGLRRHVKKCNMTLRFT